MNNTSDTDVVEVEQVKLHNFTKYSNKNFESQETRRLCVQWVRAVCVYLGERDSVTRISNFTVVRS